VRDGALERIYLATGAAGDDEMQDRITHHRKSRGEDWITIEEPLELVPTLTRESAADRTVLVDCLTLWLSNIMHAERDVETETQHLTEWLRQTVHPVVLVSNEIGLGLVPETPLGRHFRDAQGRLNQAVAAVVPQVVFVTAGLPLWLKGQFVQQKVSS
jgi:adenosylcobinamide kinase / adenosylcobinamide-phosphate guanylyltransferase